MDKCTFDDMLFFVFENRNNRLMYRDAYDLSGSYHYDNYIAVLEWLQGNHACYEEEDERSMPVVAVCTNDGKPVKALVAVFA